MSQLKQLIVDGTPVHGIEEETLTVREAVVAAGLDPNTCDVFQLDNEGDEGVLRALDYVLDLRKEGGQPGKPIRLRCAPKDRNAG